MRRYLEFLHKPAVSSQAGALESARQNLCQAPESQGISVWSHYPLAGQVLDLFCRRGYKCLAIDLIGFPGEGEGFLELERYLVLARAGLETLPLSYGLWREAPGQACRRYWCDSDAALLTDVAGSLGARRDRGQTINVPGGLWRCATLFN